jgi:hypothetical protein
MMNLRRILFCVAMFCAVLAITSSARGGWPLGRISQWTHVPRSQHEYSVAPTYNYMPRAYPYGSFGARGYSPRTVHYDYNYHLRTWGPGH